MAEIDYSTVRAVAVMTFANPPVRPDRQAFVDRQWSTFVRAVFTVPPLTSRSRTMPIPGQ
jgi:hypothetical protein